MQCIITYRSREMVFLVDGNTLSELATTKARTPSNVPESVSRCTCLLFTKSMTLATQWMPITASSQTWNCTVNTAMASTRAPITHKCHRNSITTPGILVFLPLSRRPKRRNEIIPHVMDTREVPTEAIWTNPETRKRKSKQFYCIQVSTQAFTNSQSELFDLLRNGNNGRWWNSMVNKSPPYRSFATWTDCKIRHKRVSPSMRLNLLYLRCKYLKYQK